MATHRRPRLYLRQRSLRLRTRQRPHYRQRAEHPPPIARVAALQYRRRPPRKRRRVLLPRKNHRRDHPLHRNSSRCTRRSGTNRTQHHRARIWRPVEKVVLLQAGQLPKTSSGKLQRRKTRDMYLSGELERNASRTMGSTGTKTTVAKHVARSFIARVKNIAARP